MNVSVLKQDTKQNKTSFDYLKKQKTAAATTTKERKNNKNRMFRASIKQYVHRFDLVVHMMLCTSLHQLEVTVFPESR